MCANTADQPFQSPTSSAKDVVRVETKKVTDFQYWLFVDTTIIGLLVETPESHWLGILLYPKLATIMADTKEKAAERIIRIYQLLFVD